MYFSCQTAEMINNITGSPSTDTHIVLPYCSCLYKPESGSTTTTPSSTLRDSQIIECTRQQKKPPTPPPLPPPLASHRAKSKGGESSVYPASLDAASPNFMDTAVYVPMVDEPVDEPVKPVWYFFYGTLTDPKILKHILDLNEEPFLRPAKIIGYKLSSWGQYKALIDGEPGAEVFGFAYEVQTIEHEFKLARYETNAYTLKPCRFHFTDSTQPKELSGNTFMYAGDSAALQAGRFDRVLWELQMGTRLPDTWKTPTHEVMRQMGVNVDGYTHP